MIYPDLSGRVNPDIDRGSASNTSAVFLWVTAMAA